MEQTRVLILERAAELLAEDALPELTVPDAAARAGVSVRTAYRYFPTKEALHEALNEWIMRRWGPYAGPPAHADELPEYVGKLYMSFSDNEVLLRASRRSRAASELKKQRKTTKQMPAMLAIVRSVGAELDGGEERRYAAALHGMLSSEHYLALRDFWGMSVNDATASTRWGVEGMLGRLRQLERSGQKKGGS